MVLCVPISIPFTYEYSSCNSFTSGIKSVQLLSCKTVFASDFISLCFGRKCEKTDHRTVLLQNSGTDGCPHIEGMTSVSLGYSLSPFFASTHNIRNQKNIHAHNCVQACSGMKMATHVHRVCSRRSFTLMELLGVEQVPGRQCDPTQTLQGNSNKRDLGRGVPVEPRVVILWGSSHRERLGNGWGAGMPRR